MKKRYITAAGKTRSMDDWSVLTGVSKSIMHNRLKAWYTPEQVVGLEKTDRQERSEANLVRVMAKPKRPTFTARGFTGTISEIATYFKVGVSVIRGRQRMGWLEDDWVQPVVKVSKLERDKIARDKRWAEARAREEFMELVGTFD